MKSDQYIIINSHNVLFHSYLLLNLLWQFKVHIQMYLGHLTYSNASYLKTNHLLKVRNSTFSQKITAANCTL